MLEQCSYNETKAMAAGGNLDFILTVTGREGSLRLVCPGFFEIDYNSTAAKKPLSSTLYKKEVIIAPSSLF